MDKFKCLEKSKINKVPIQRMLKDSKVSVQVPETTARIDSPIAKYDLAGNLTCIICKSIVKSANVWKVHINSKQHKQKLDLAKQQKISYTPVSALKSQQQTNKTNIQQNVNNKAVDVQKASKRKAPIEPPISAAYMELLPQSAPISKDKNVLADLLPEKFFDDPVSDAKARNIELKDSQDEEWARFQREIKQESTLSNAIIAEEQDDENLKRQIFEIDDQIKKWSKVIEITEKKKHISRSTNNERNANSFENEVANSSDDSDIGEEVEDWRIKRLH